MITSGHNDETRDALSKILKWRDALLIQSVLDDRCASKAERRSPETQPGTALVHMDDPSTAESGRMRNFACADSTTTLDFLPQRSIAAAVT
jgi:hypothetical protein